MACDDFEVAIEMRHRGALEATAADELDRHLSGCAACRAYGDLIARTERNMTGNAAATLKQFDWTHFEASRVQRLAKATDRRPSLLRLLFSLALFSPVLIRLAIPADHHLENLVTLAVLALGGLAALGGRINRTRWAAEAREAARSREDTIAFWRSDLDRRSARAALLGTIEAMIGLTLLAALAALLAVQADVARFDVALIALIAAVMVGNGLWWRLRYLPQSRRERAELG